MEKFDIDKVSTENLRLFVLELTLYIEELISQTIGKILDIDWENSKSFGFSSSSLSFNQKAIIIQDLKDITSDEIKKFGYLMNIRNKFAHVRSVKTYSDFHLTAGNGVEIKTKLENWYKNELPEDISDEDEVFKIYFKLLCKDIISKLWEIIIRIQIEKVNKSSDEYRNIAKYIELENALKKFPEGNGIIDELEEKWKKKH